MVGWERLGGYKVDELDACTIVSSLLRFRSFVSVTLVVYPCSRPGFSAPGGATSFVYLNGLYEVGFGFTGRGMKCGTTINILSDKGGGFFNDFHLSGSKHRRPSSVPICKIPSFFPSFVAPRTFLESFDEIPRRQR